MANASCDYRRAGAKIVCRNCGRTFDDIRMVRGAICGEPITPRRDPTSCQHFVAWTGTNTEAKCGGCQSAKAMTALAECELHGLVTPIGVAKDKSIRSCRGCESYEAES